MATHVVQGQDDSISQFEHRMDYLRGELQAIDKELRQVDLLELARRTRELLRGTKGLLEGNVTALFHNQPARVPEDLYKHIEFAEGHVHKALAEEYDFQAIKHRLSMATSLCDYVIHSVAQAIERLKREGYY